MKFSLYIALYVSMQSGQYLDREFILETYDTPEQCLAAEDAYERKAYELNLQYVTIGAYCVRNVGEQ